MDPAGQADGLADIGLPQLSAGVAAVAMHGRWYPIGFVRPHGGIRPRNRPEKRMGGPLCQGKRAMAGPFRGGMKALRLDERLSGWNGKDVFIIKKAV
jgi:hypothetical protein